MNDEAIILEQPDENRELFTARFSSEQNYQVAEMQSGETKDINIGRYLLIIDKVLEEALNRKLPDTFPVTFLRNGEKLTLPKPITNLGQLRSAFLIITKSPDQAFSRAVAEYRKFKNLDNKAITEFGGLPRVFFFGQRLN